MAYRFKRKVESLKTGRSYTKGSIVPDGLIAPDFLNAMVKSGDIEKTGLIVEPEIIEEVAEEIVELEDYVPFVGGSSWPVTETPKLKPDSKTFTKKKREV